MGIGPEPLAIARQHYQANRFATAAQLCRELLQADASQPAVWLLLGLCLYRQGQIQEAEQCYRTLLTHQPDHIDALSNLGVMLKAQGRLEEAVQIYERAVAQAPQSAALHNNLGNARWQQGRLDAASHHFHQALQLAPEDLDIRQNLGNVLRELGDDAGAIAHYRHLLHHRPQDSAVLNNLGNALQGLRQFAQAVSCYQMALKHAPRAAHIWSNLGSALQEQGEMAAAIAAFQRALHLKPAYADAYYNLGNLWRSQDRLSAATVAYRQAIALRPTFTMAYNNLGLVLHDQGDYVGAIAAYDQALALDPDHADAHLNRGLSHLMRGNLEDGWRDYEWRWRVIGPNFKPPRKFDQPPWDGSDLAGQTILLHAEQGLGDTLQFIRFAPLVKAKGGTVIVECPPPLLRLFQSISSIDHLIPTGHPLPPFHVHAPLMSLPHLLGITLANLPSPVPYLQPPNQPKSKIQNPKSQTVGIVWAGSSGHRGDRHRSTPLHHFVRLLDLPQVQLYSLQKGEREKDLAQLGDRADDISNLAPDLSDMADTAAAISQLDLVITVDTSVAHLAGALGKPVWILLGATPDWRWLSDRPDSPWYPTARLFRQSSPGDWDSVFDQVLAALTSSPPSPHPPISPSPHLPTQLAHTAYRQKRYREAATLYEQVLAATTDPSDRLDLQTRLGNAYLHQGQAQRAIALYQAVLAQEPQRSSVRNNLGVALRQLGRHSEAIAHYRFLLQQQSTADAHYNLANALRDEGQLDGAIHHYRQAIQHQPTAANAWNNLANSLKDAGQVDGAIACYRHTLTLAPHHASAHYNLGYALLLKGDLAAGFAEYEWRWRVANFRAPRAFSQPQWDGSHLDGATVLLYTEQGFGDAIQFSRYIPLVAQRGGRVMLECRPPLMGLLATVPGVAQVISREEATPPFAVYAPLMSLPHILGTTVDTVPAPIPYLAPPPEDFSLPDGGGHLAATTPLRVGLVWAGSPTHKNDAHRSCPFMHIWRLLRSPGVAFYSLQKGDRRRDLTDYCDEQWPLIDLSDRLQDFAATAAAIAQLDLVITVDTAVAHLAGALGKPVWILLAHPCDWRWLGDGDDSPWYPTARLFRQSQPGNWAELLGRVQRALVAWQKSSERS